MLVNLSEALRIFVIHAGEYVNIPTIPREGNFLKSLEFEGFKKIKIIIY